MRRLISSVAVWVCIMLSSYQLSAVTRTWTGVVSTNWTTAGNWSPSGAPSAGDDLIFNQSGINTSIQSIPDLRLNSITVQSTGSAISYSFAITGSKTLSFSGTGTCFTVGQNCTLTTASNLTLDMGAWGALSSMVVNGSFIVNGPLVFEWNAGQLTVGNGASMTMNGILTYNSTNGILNITGNMQVNTDLTIPSSDAQINIGSTGSFTVQGAFNYKASGNITVNGSLTLYDSFTVSYTSSQLVVGQGGNLQVTGSFLYQSSGNISVNGTMTTNSMEISWTQSQIVIGTTGILSINGPFTYHSSKNFINNGNGTFHINNSYNSNTTHTITGTGTVRVDPGDTLILNSDLIIDGDLNVFGILIVPITRTLTVNGVLYLRPS
jgi:hypothetical protein